MSPSSPASHRSAFRPDIEGLRGIAVLIVVAFHCGMPGAGAGFIGVDVFFVLSGYLITGLLVKEVEKTGRVDILQFYARRMRRLLPAASLVTLVTLLVGAAVLAPREMTEAGRAARASALYLSNVFFAVNAADYFAADVETNPMLHTWSLAVEEQFYVFWPLLIMVALQWWRSHRALIAMLSGVATASLALSLYTTYTDTNLAFYSLPTRSWEFAVGGLAALLPVSRFRGSDTAFAACSWIGLIVLTAATVVRPQGIPFPGWLALPPVLATMMMLVGAAGAPHRGVAPALGRPSLQFLGKYSYSWYLWHWPFLVFAQALLPTIGLTAKAGAALLSLAVAFVTHRLVENPLRFHPLLVRRPLASLALGVVLMTATIAAAAGNLRLATTLAAQPELQAISAAVDDVAAIPRQECVTVGKSPELKTCRFGAAQGPRTVVLFGDSHAIQWFDAFRRIADDSGWQLVTMLKSGCPAYDFSPASITVGTAGEENCREWRRSAIAEIARLRPDAVVVGSARVYMDGEAATRDDLDRWRDGAARTYEALRRTGARVAALRDTPQPGFDVPTCLARATRNSWYPGGDCSFERDAAVGSLVFEAELQAARSGGGITFIDVTDEICESQVCRAARAGMILYRDDNHLTGTFARSLAPALVPKLRSIMNGSERARVTALYPVH